MPTTASSSTKPAAAKKPALSEAEKKKQLAGALETHKKKIDLKNGLEKHSNNLSTGKVQPSAKTQASSGSKTTAASAKTVSKPMANTKPNLTEAQKKENLAKGLQKHNDNLKTGKVTVSDKKKAPAAATGKPAAAASAQQKPATAASTAKSGTQPSKPATTTAASQKPGAPATTKPTTAAATQNQGAKPHPLKEPASSPAKPSGQTIPKSSLNSDQQLERELKEYQEQHDKIKRAEMEFERAENEQNMAFQEAKILKLRLLGIGFFILFSFLIWKLLTEPEPLTRTKLAQKLPSFTKIPQQDFTEGGPEIQKTEKEPGFIEKTITSMTQTVKKEISPLTQDQIHSQNRRTELKLHLLELARELNLDLEAWNLEDIVEGLLTFKLGTKELTQNQLRASQVMATQLLHFDQEDLSSTSRAAQVQFIQLLSDCQKKKKAAGYYGVEKNLEGWVQRWKEARKQT